jgi:outer membrane lipase/esterase
LSFDQLYSGHKEGTYNMKHLRLIALACSGALVLAACGSGGGTATSSTIGFTKMISFGDSLSDVGTYKIGTVAAVGGGLYTVNGPDAKNWTQLVAGQFGLPAPCPAQTGLDGNPAVGFFQAPKNDANCTNYAQGGARVTNPVGPGNKLLGPPNDTLGQLTVPVKTQIANHLAANAGAFKTTELVTVLAGGNDLFINAATIAPTVAALVKAGQTPAAAQQAAVTTAVTEMGKAGAELAGYIDALIVQKGAKYIAVVNLPSVGNTPYAIAQGASTQQLFDTMVKTFNTQLTNGLAGKAGVVIIDAYTESNNQFTTPAVYGLSNVTDAACSKTSPQNPLNGSALTCTAKSLIAGDTSRYQFADDVHLTPFGNSLLAKFILINIGNAGWL